MKIFRYISILLLALNGLFFHACTTNPNNNEGFNGFNVVDTLSVESILAPDTVSITDTIVIPHVTKEFLYRDTVIVPPGLGIDYRFVVQPKILDSIKTQELLEQTLWKGYIDLKENDYGGIPQLYNKHEQEYLPYLMLTFSNPEILPSIVANLRTQYNNVMSNPDSLRKQVLLYNDRQALDVLEEHYRAFYPKGIAIYYKVLLSYEGNGDLAERFYRVLEPYLDETPQFRIAVREVLLRAALCDHNERAQELCDSLGFSLCDYKTNYPKQSSYLLNSK